LEEVKFLPVQKYYRSKKRTQPSIGVSGRRGPKAVELKQRTHVALHDVRVVRRGMVLEVGQHAIGFEHLHHVQRHLAMSRAGSCTLLVMARTSTVVRVRLRSTEVQNSFMKSKMALVL
jgi:hypothetical protein